MPGAAAGAARLPFTSAALRYREKIFTKQWTPGAAAVDLSPPGGAIKSYGYLRALHLLITTATAGVLGAGVAAADHPWSLLSQISVTQPNGEEMYGGPTWTGFHAKVAMDHAGWRLNDGSQVMPSFVTTLINPQLDIIIPFEMDAEHGVGALPNQDFSAPWKIQVTGGALSTAIYTTNPTTAPTLQLDIFMDTWTVPSPVNPLNPQISQEVAPPLLGALNKWSVQQYAVTASAAQSILLSRKGNSIRNLCFIARGAGSLRVAISNMPDPLAIRWDGTVVRSNDKPLLIIDDEYRTRGGVAAATPLTADVGVMCLQMSDISGVDAQGVAENFGMGAFWGTVQSSVIELSGTFGPSITLLEVLTNDVQFVDLAGNPYAFAYGGYLQAPAQVGARP